MNQTEFLAITCNLLKWREKSRVEGAIGYGFTSLAEYLVLVYRKSRKRFGPEKTFRNSPTHLFCKLVFSYVVKGIKIITKLTTKFRASIRLRFEDTKRAFKPNSQACRQSIENHSITPAVCHNS